jgi:hypothetical protein
MTSVYIRALAQMVSWYSLLECPSLSSLRFEFGSKVSTRNWWESPFHFSSMYHWAWWAFLPVFLCMTCVIVIRTWVETDRDFCLSWKSISSLDFETGSKLNEIEANPFCGCYSLTTTVWFTNQWPFWKRIALSGVVSIKWSSNQHSYFRSR